MWKKFLVVTLTVCGLQCVLCSLTLGEVRCGQRTCPQMDYCSPVDTTCRPCKGVCDSSTHNYDRELCEKNCQDYIHDQRYVRVDGGNGGGDENLRGTVQQLSRMVTVTLTLVCLMLLILASVFIFQLYRWKVKKNITLVSIKNKILGKKTPEDQAGSKNNHSESKRNELKLNIPSTVAVSDHSPVTVTTSISRAPAEDNALDYAYDNPAMASSPK